MFKVIHVNCVLEIGASYNEHGKNFLEESLDTPTWELQLRTLTKMFGRALGKCKNRHIAIEH